MDQQTSEHAALTGGHEGEKHGPCPTFSITQLAEEFGLTTRAIRFYEDKGLLSPQRQGQTRIYYPRDRARLTLIVRGKNVGLALSEIKEILDHYDPAEDCETQDRIALDKFRKRITSLERQRDEIGLQVATLQDACRRLEERIAADAKSGKDAPKKRQKASVG